MWDLRTDNNNPLDLDGATATSTNLSIQHVDVDAEGTKLAAITNRGDLYVWNLVGADFAAATSNADACYRTSRVVFKQKSPAHRHYGLKCRFSPDSTLLATTSADETIRLWQTADLVEHRTLVPIAGERQKWVWDCAFSVDSQHVISCSSDALMRLWNVDAGHCVRQYVGHQRPITAMAFRDYPPIAPITANVAPASAPVVVEYRQ
jgi:G protein beta subunit-like protein